MLKRSQSRRSNAIYKGHERLILIHIGSNDERIDEHTDHRFQRCPGAARNRSSDHKLRLTRAFREEQMKNCQQHHVSRSACLRCQSMQAFGNIRRDRKRMLIASIAFQRRPWVIRRQIQHRPVA
ncbi:hypothetical protein D3C76_890650 [compost metagenome]